MMIAISRDATYDHTLGMFSGQQSGPTQIVINIYILNLVKVLIIMTQIITGLISVARDGRLVYKVLLDLYFQEIAKINYKYVIFRGTTLQHPRASQVYAPIIHERRKLADLTIWATSLTITEVMCIWCSSTASNDRSVNWSRWIAIFGLSYLTDNLNQNGLAQVFFC